VPTTPFITKASQAGQPLGKCHLEQSASAVATAPVAGAKYEAVANGVLYGQRHGQYTIRNPASGSGDAVDWRQNVPGDSLTLNAGTDIRAKGPGTF
jgi:hypothetical protein